MMTKFCIDQDWLRYFNNEIDQKKLKKILLKFIRKLRKIENTSFQQKDPDLLSFKLRWV